MKRIILIATVIFAIVISTQTIQAQVRVGVNINIGSQPAWGPVGYDYAEYYYLPDIDAYYYVPRHQFIYLSNGQWIFSAALPPRYRGYNLYSGYKVVLNEPRPYLHHTAYRERYAPYRDRHDQVIIRDSHDPKYYHHDNGHHYGWRNHDKEHGHHHD
jgi:hypothetical protein